MVQGTGSSVGKSLIAAALCRIFAQAGLTVAPFKAQNMSNNAAALPSGGEIGRAQALQALAARVPARVEMNPVLLKPEGDSRSQVIVLGRPYKTLSVREYRFEHDYLWAIVTASLDRLRAESDLVIVEGAGSPAEINLRDGEIVNMAVALYAQAPVILVADIDPGGVFAQIVGTLALLEPEERTLVRGVVINKFRGDRSLLEPGLDMLVRLTGLPVLGVVPMLHNLSLAEEDGAALESGRKRFESPALPKLDIAVLRFPRIANFDDFDALNLEPGVNLRYVSSPEELGFPDAVILPGTKATLADLDWLRQRGLDEGILWLAKAGRSVLGICGGFQMLGEELSDPEGVEGFPRSEPGLGLLPLRTVFSPAKLVSPRRGRISASAPPSLAAAVGLPVEGYEIHSGLSRIEGPALFEFAAPDAAADAADGARRTDGTWSCCGRVLGTYLHGLFDLPGFRRAWLSSLGVSAQVELAEYGGTLAEAREESLDRLAESVAASLDIAAIRRIISS